MEPKVRTPTKNTRGITLKLRVSLILLTVTLVGILAPSLRPAQGAELSTAQKEYLRKLDAPVVLRGDYFRAVTVAYADYSKTLAAYQARSKNGSGERASTLQWLSHIENYDIRVEQTNTTFVVSFPPTVRGDAPIIMGGVTQYEIDRKTFQIRGKSTGK